MINILILDLAGNLVVKNPPADAGDMGQLLWPLVREDPVRHGATKPVHHNYWACSPRACAPQQKKPLQWKACALLTWD